MKLNNYVLFSVIHKIYNIETYLQTPTLRHINTYNVIIKIYIINTKKCYKDRILSKGRNNKITYLQYNFFRMSLIRFWLNLLNSCMLTYTGDCLWW